MLYNGVPLKSQDSGLGDLPGEEQGRLPANRTNPAHLNQQLTLYTLPHRNVCPV